MAEIIDVGTLNMVFLIGSIVAGVLIVWGFKPASTRQKIKEEMNVQRDREKRKEEEQNFEKDAPKVANAEKEEEKETREIIHIVNELEPLVKMEKSIMPKVEELLKHEKSKGIESAGKGLPEANEIFRLCREENKLLEEAFNRLKKPEEISGKILHFMEKEEKRLRDETARLDLDERIANTDHAETSQEHESVNKEDNVERKQVIDMQDIETEERRVIKEIRAARRLCREIMDLNGDMIHLAMSNNDKVNANIEKIGRIEKDIGKKEEKLHKLMIALRIMSSYETQIEEHTKRAEKEGKEVMAA
jgi:hypothetical protein